MLINFCDTDYIKYTEKVRNLIGADDKKVYITTFGCQQNEADSERIKGYATQMGYEVTECDLGGSCA